MAKEDTNSEVEAKDLDIEGSSVLDQSETSVQDDEKTVCITEPPTKDPYGSSFRPGTRSTVTKLVYDLLRILFLYVLHGFFREIRSRGAHKIPMTGPVIFAGGPHANQFVDPIMLMTNTLRRIGFLTARKSWDHPFIGTFAKIFGAIPVIRPQDITFPGAGTVYVDMDSLEEIHRETALMEAGGDEDGKDGADAAKGGRVTPVFTIKGVTTKFTRQLKPRFSISLTKSGPLWTVDRVISDTEVIVKKPPTSEEIESLSADHRTKFSDSNKGCSYIITPHVVQGEMFNACYEVLNAGEAIGIFPEGGSHDRPEMLPFKPGVGMIALGTLERYPDMDLKIVPVGLHYFHCDRFRSRAVVEFGDPIIVPRKLVEKFASSSKGKRQAVAILVDTIQTAVRGLTVSAPDFDTLMIAQAARRIYRPLTTRLTLDDVLELSRRITAGYTRFKNEPDIKEFTANLKKYNKQLEYMGLRDHQVRQLSTWRLMALLTLLLRVVELAFLVLLGSFGVLLSAPIWSIAIFVSKRKMVEAKAGSSVKIWGKDVVASWKVITGLILAPFFHFFYTFLVLGFCIFYFHTNWTTAFFYAFITFILLPLGAFETLRVFDSGTDLHRSLTPLRAAIFQSSSTIQELKMQRIHCMEMMVDLIDIYGPRIYGPQFEEQRIVHSDDIRRSILIEKMEVSSDFSEFKPPPNDNEPIPAKDVNDDDYDDYEESQQADVNSVNLTAVRNRKLNPVVSRQSLDDQESFTDDLGDAKLTIRFQETTIKRKLVNSKIAKVESSSLTVDQVSASTESLISNGGAEEMLNGLRRDMSMMEQLQMITNNQDLETDHLHNLLGDTNPSQRCVIM